MVHSFLLRDFIEITKIYLFGLLTLWFISHASYERGHSHRITIRLIAHAARKSAHEDYVLWAGSHTVCHNPFQISIPSSLNYHITLFKVGVQLLHGSTQPSSKYDTTIFKVPHYRLQSSTPPSSMCHTTIFKVPHHPLQSTAPPSLKYHTTLFNVPQHPLQSTTPPSSK